MRETAEQIKSRLICACVGVGVSALDVVHDVEVADQASDETTEHQADREGQVGRAGGGAAHENAARVRAWRLVDGAGYGDCARGRRRGVRVRAAAQQVDDFRRLGGRSGCGADVALRQPAALRDRASWAQGIRPRSRIAKRNGHRRSRRDRVRDPTWRAICRRRREKGGKERPGPLDVLAIAMSTEHVLITGESGCDHDRLARAIHTMSLRRAHDLVQINSVPNDRAGQRKLIDSASRSTLILEITDAMQPLDATFVSMLMSPSYHVRVIVLASTTERASAVLGAEAVKRMTEIHLRPVAFRPSAILWLADATLRERGATLQVSDLTAANRHALESYEWPGNLRELRQVADWLITVEKCGSIRAAAEQLNVPRTTLARALAKIGLTVPLTRHGRGVDAR